MTYTNTVHYEEVSRSREAVCLPGECRSEVCSGRRAYRLLHNRVRNTHTQPHIETDTQTRRRRFCCTPICDRRSACVHARAFQLRLSGCDGRAWNATHTQKTIETRVVRMQEYFIPVYVKVRAKVSSVCARAWLCFCVYLCGVVLRLSDVCV